MGVKGGRGRGRGRGRDWLVAGRQTGESVLAGVGGEACTHVSELDNSGRKTRRISSSKANVRVQQYSNSTCQKARDQ